MSAQRNKSTSTGPKTPAGKAVSRTNAYKHGMRTRTVVIPGENLQDYENLRNAMCEELEPRTRHEDFLVKQMADAMWRLDRLKGIESALYAEDEVDPAELERIARFQVRMEHSYYKAYNQFQTVTKERKSVQMKEEKEQEAELAKHPQPRKQVLYWLDDKGNPILAPGFTEKDVEEAKEEYVRLTGKDPSEGDDRLRWIKKS